MTSIKYDSIFDVVSKTPEESSELQALGDLLISLRDIVGDKMKNSSLDPNTFNQQDVLDALNGLISPESLTAEEQAVFMDEFAASMYEETEEQKAFFKNQIKLGLGVGLDDNDNIVHQSSKNEGNAV